MHYALLGFLQLFVHSIKHQTIHIFQIKHIRGILFDDTEKSGRNKSTAQSISSLKFAKPTTTGIAANKKVKITQDDSVLNYKVSAKETIKTATKLPQQKLDKSSNE